MFFQRFILVLIVLRLCLIILMFIIKRILVVILILVIVVRFSGYGSLTGIFRVIVVFFFFFLVRIQIIVCLRLVIIIFFILRLFIAITNRYRTWFMCLITDRIFRIAWKGGINRSLRRQLFDCKRDFMMKDLKIIIIIFRVIIFRI